MTRLKFVMLSMLAVLAVSGVASATASAACKTGDENKAQEVCIETAKGVFAEADTLAEKEAVSLKNSNTATKSILVSKVAGVEVEVECTKATFEDKPKPKGADGESEGEITFGDTTKKAPECTVLKPAGKCIVKEPIKATFVDATAGLAAGEVKFDGTGAAKTFTELTFENKGAETCTVAGTFAVTGSQVCKVSTPTTFAVAHEVKCEKAGSTLKLGKEKASFSATFKGVEFFKGVVASKLPWSLEET